MKTRVSMLALLLLYAGAIFGALEDQWRREQHLIETQLAKKHFSAARGAAIRLTRTMLDNLGTGAEAHTLLAKSSALRASAEEGMGNADDASWYRDVAAALDEHRRPADAETSRSEPIVSAEKLSAANATPPRVTHRNVLARPEIIRYIGASTVIVGVVIGTDGLARHPRIVSSPAPSLSYIAIEALREWRFQPAAIDGKPAAVLFNLTITFR
jgi:outer membrane biosynthesis protein TonB